MKQHSNYEGQDTHVYRYILNLYTHDFGLGKAVYLDRICTKYL